MRSDFLIDNFNKNNIDIAKENKNVEMEKFYFDTVKDAYKTTDKEYKDLQLNLRKTELDQYAKDRDRNLSLVNEYYTYTKAVDTLEIEKDNLKISEEEFNKTAKLFEFGQISQIQYDAASNQYEEAKFNYEKAVIAYNTAFMKLSNIIKGIK